jgi:hypothetical protein
MPPQIAASYRAIQFAFSWAFLLGVIVDVFFDASLRFRGARSRPARAISFLLIARTPPDT